MGESLDAKTKTDKFKALQKLVDALGEEGDNTDGMVPILGLDDQTHWAIEQLEREGYAERTQRTSLGGQGIPAYIITENGVRHYNRVIDSISELG